MVECNAALWAVSFFILFPFFPLSPSLSLALSIVAPSPFLRAVDDAEVKAWILGIVALILNANYRKSVVYTYIDFRYGFPKDAQTDAS